MQGTTTTRSGRVLAYLVTHPQHLPFYLSRGPFTRQTPLDLWLPWFSLPAIRFLDRSLTRSMTVFEYGSGGSTLYFSRRVRSVVSTEDNAAWLERVRHELVASGSTNVELQLRPLDPASDFQTSAYLHSIPDRAFDIIVIDGTELTGAARPACSQLAESRIRPGGMIILDDSWRYPELRRNHHARSTRTFRGIGPCRAGVTTTDLFFY